MRYYDITAGPLHYSSLGPDGTADPGALLVEIDITVLNAGAASQGAWVRIWGVGQDVISQSQQLWKQPITVNAGMSQGLPLAHPEQQGCLASGTIYQAYGNWVGVNQTLDLIFTSSATNVPTDGNSNPLPPNHNGVLNWRKGQDLSGPLQQALQQAFPDMQVNMAIGQYQAPSDQIHYFNSLAQLGTWLQRFTQQPIFNSPNNQGVSIVPYNGSHNVMDGSQPSGGTTVNYEDLIGEPTWIAPNVLQTKLVMRGDLKVGDTMTLPPTLVQTAGGVNFGQQGTSLTFSGSSNIQELHHIGNSRNPDGESWITVVTSNVQSTSGTGS